MEWLQSVTRVDLLNCENKEHISSNLVQLRSMPSLRTLVLPTSCTEREVDAEAVYGLTTLTGLQFLDRWDAGENVEVEEAGQWVLDLRRLTTLTSLHFHECPTWTAEQVEAASSLTGLTELNIFCCPNVTTEGLRTVSGRTVLTNLNLARNDNMTTEVLRELSRLTALTTLNLASCPNVTAAGKQALHTALPNLTLRGRWRW